MPDDKLSEHVTQFDAFVEDAEAKQNKSFVNNWELIDELGKGAFGATFVAQRIINVYDRPVILKGAIKLINLERGLSAGRITSIVSELEKLSHLNSRYIASLIDAGLVDIGKGVELPYFVMDFIEGSNLTALVKSSIENTKKGLSADKFKTLALNTLRALKAAHSINLIHLDIKPENIMFSESDQAFVLIDFGISEFLTGDVLKDFFGGTPGFMAPEVLRTKATKPSDIFSLGLTFYYAITGVHPILAELRSRAKSNPDLLKNPTRAIQRIYEEIEYNFDLFSQDQRALVEPMLRINPKERPSLELLIKTASQLEVRFEASPEISGGHDSNKIYGSWSELKPYLENLVRQQGVSGFTVTVDENSQFSLWFKPLTLGDDLYVTCTKPKNSTNLGMIGWTTLDSTIMMKKVPKDPKVIAKEIAKAMEIGFQLKPPIVIS